MEYSIGFNNAKYFVCIDTKISLIIIIIITITVTVVVVVISPDLNYKRLGVRQG